MDSKQVPKTPSPHDQFFKGMFSQPEIAESYIRSFLPKEIWQHLPFDQLKLDNTSYVTSELKAYFSDLVWQCPYRDSEINITFLFEHKTYQPKYLHLELLRYMLQLWEQDLKEKRKYLRPIIPIIVYQGTKKWKIRPMIECFPEMKKPLRRYLPDFEYELNDLHQIPEDDMLKLESKKLTLALYSMANYRSFLTSAENLDRIFFVFDHFENIEENTNFVNMILVYLMKTNHLKSKEMREILEKSKSKSMHRAKTTYEQFVDEGRKIGFKEGLDKGKEAGVIEGIELAILKAYKSGQTVEFIASMFELPVEKVISVIQK